MQSKKILLRVRARFVQCRDTLMQILVHRDRDKNSSVGTAGTLVASEKRLMVGLCFAAKITNQACEWEETYSQTLFSQKDYQSSLWVRRDLQSDFAFFLFATKVTNRACKWEENYGQTCFIFEETYGRTFCQKDYPSSLWVSRDLWSDLFYFLFIIQLANTWLKKKKKILLQTGPFIWTTVALWLKFCQQWLGTSV